MLQHEGVKKFMNFKVYERELYNQIVLFSILVVISIVFTIFIYIRCIKNESDRKWRNTLIALLLILNIVAIGIWVGFVPNMIIDIHKNNFVSYKGLMFFEKPNQKTSIIYFDEGQKKLVTEPYIYKGMYKGTLIYSGKSKVLLDLEIEEKVKGNISF